MNTDPPEGAEPWQREAWAHKDTTNPFAQFEPLFDKGCFPRGHGSFPDLGYFPRAHGTVDYGNVSANVVWGRCSMDPDEFEAAILGARDEYERRLGVVPTVIDLPNWVRGTILEQIAFTHGFNIADPRDEPNT